MRERYIFCVQATGFEKKKDDCTVTKSASNNDLLCVVNFNWENQLAERDEIVQTNQIDGAPNL